MQLILFDYGETLIHEEYFDPFKGTEAVLKHSNSTVDIHEIQNLAYRFSKQQRKYSIKEEIGNYIEIPNEMFQSYLYDYYGIEIYLSKKTMEEVFWDHAAPYVKCKGSEELLNYLKKKGYKIGVISNIAFQRDLLKKRLAREFPNIEFDLVITSADYGLRKPNSLLFELALHIMKIEAKDTIYIGDSYNSDVLGALYSHITPIYITEENIDGVICKKNLKEVKEWFEHE